MRMRLGMKVGLIGSAAAITVTVDAIVVLGQAIPYSITGTTSAPDGSTVDVIVNGEVWGSDTVSGGAWTVEGTPTAAMVGDDVTVEATISGASGTTTTDVVLGTAYWGGDIGVADTGGLIDSHTDQIGGVVAAGSGGTRPTTDGSADIFDVALSQKLDIGSGVSSETSHLVIFVMDVTIGPPRRTMLEFDSFGFRLDTDGIVRYYDGANKGTQKVTSGPHVITYDLDGVAGIGEIRADGAVLETGLSYTPKPLTASVAARIGATSSDTYHFHGKQYAIWIASAAATPLTAAQIAEFETQLANHHLGGMPT